MKSFLLCIFVLSLVSCNRDTSAKQTEWLKTFTQKNYIGVVEKPFVFESFNLADSSGKKFDFSTLKGKVVLLNFFATWCPPCVGELPEFEKYMQKFDKKKFQVVAINAKESASRVDAFMQRHKYHFPAIIDLNGDFFMRYNVRSLPASLIIDKKGFVRFSIQGVRDWSSKDFEKFFTLLMDEK